MIRRAFRRLFAALAVLMLPVTGHAACSLYGPTENVNFVFANPVITIDPNAGYGTVLASTPQVTPNPTDSFLYCFSRSTTYGVVNSAGVQPNSSSATIFPIGSTGIGYRISHPTSYLVPYGGGSIGSGQWNLSITSGLELVKIGPITNGQTIGSTNLGNWVYANNVTAESFNLQTSLTFVYPTCSVNTSTINVTLPTVSNTAFNGVGTVAGATVVPISLQCASGSQLYIQFDTATPASGFTGVIAAATGTGRAKNIGVQLIDQTFVPVTFGTPALVGSTPDGPMNLTYYARYYQTATPVAAGTVSATATFTLSYQ